MPGAAVELLNLRHAYPESGGVLESMDLRIQAGEFVTLLGPSGCGKSTLLKLIAGLENPSEGQVHVLSEGAEFFRGFVFQESHLLPWRNVLENAALPLQLMRHPRDKALQAAREALAKVGLSDSLHKFPNQLSGGMKMRVSVARALVARPSLLLLDEPFSALDESIREQLQEDLRDLWQRHRMTVIFVTHSVSEAVFLSRRVLVMSPRPARIVFDREIDLPEERGPSLRDESRYWREVSELSAAFRSCVGRGGQK